MKKALVALFFGILGSLAHASASDKWNDALSGPSSFPSDNISLGTTPISTPSQSTVPVSAGREIIIAHLNKIKSSQLMVNTISLEPYWQGVFAAAGRPELYASSQADIQLALEAGLSPYLRGEAITAQQFADAALTALEKSASSSMASAPEKDLFHH